MSKYDLEELTRLLVEPSLNIVTVYSSMTDWETFSNNEVVDEKMDIRLAVNDIFL